MTKLQNLLRGQSLRLTLLLRWRLVGGRAIGARVVVQLRGLHKHAVPSIAVPIVAVSIAIPIVVLIGIVAWAACARHARI